MRPGRLALSLVKECPPPLPVGHRLAACILDILGQADRRPGRRNGLFTLTDSSAIVRQAHGNLGLFRFVTKGLGQFLQGR